MSRKARGIVGVSEQLQNYTMVYSEGRQMTVAELIEILGGMPETAQVILQKDAEGNGYSPLECVDADAIYVPESTWSGSVLRTRWTAEDADMEPQEWESMKLNNPRCCVLTPVN